LCGQDKCGACCQCTGDCEDNVSFDWCLLLGDNALFHKEQKCFDVKCKEMGACCIWNECFPYETQYDCDKQYGEYIGTCETCEKGLCSINPTPQTETPTSVPTPQMETPTSVPTPQTETPTGSPTSSPTQTPQLLLLTGEGQLGSCCGCDGECTDDTTQGVCDTVLGGIWNALTKCHDITCPRRGGCCSLGICLPYVTPSLCVGTYQGDCTDCEDISCPISLFSIQESEKKIISPTTSTPLLTVGEEGTTSAAVSDIRLVEELNNTACCLADTCTETSDATTCKSQGGLYLTGFTCSQIDCSSLTSTTTSNDKAVIISVSVVAGVIILVVVAMACFVTFRSTKQKKKRRRAKR